MNRLTTAETAAKALATLASVPLFPLGFFSVRAQHQAVVSYFGKVDRITGPGLQWVSFAGTWREVFVGPCVIEMKGLRLVDSMGTPIVVSAALQYRVADATVFVTKSNSKTDTLERATFIALRQLCGRYPCLAESGPDLRRLTSNRAMEFADSLEATANEFGFTVDTLNLIEVNYAPEIAAAMLMKQQAQAYLAARKEIVAGAVGVAKETIASLPELSKTAQEGIVTNLLTTLTSGATPQPVVQLR